MPIKKETERKILFVMVLIAFVFVFFGNKRENARFDPLIPLHEGWVMEGRGIPLPFDIPKEDGGVYSVTNVLPPSFDEELALVFKSENIYWRVFVDGMEIDSYQESDLAVGMTPGDLWNIVTIPKESAGKEVKIEMHILYENGSNLLRSIHYAPLNIAVQASIMQGVPGFVICIIILVISLFYIISDLLIFRKQTGKFALFFWSLFSISLTVWSLSQTSVMQIVLGNGVAIRMMNYGGLSFILGFAIIFVSQGKSQKIQAVAGATALLSMLWGVAVVVLDLYKVMSYVETTAYTRYMIIAFLIFILIFLTLNFKDYKKKELRQKIYMYGNLAILISGASDLYRAYNLGSEDYSRNTRIALLAYALAVGVDFFIGFIENIKLVESSKVMKKLAHSDGLTGISNRMAFDDLIEEIIKTDQKEIAIVQMDVNYLKRMNDEYGHLEGDVLLKTVARTIEAAFSEGQCFRYGGDEFIVVVFHRDKVVVENAISKFLEREEEINRKEKLKIPMSVAYGYAILEDRSTIFDTIKKADDAMYHKKREMKNT